MGVLMVGPVDLETYDDMDQYLKDNTAEIDARPT